MDKLVRKNVSSEVLGAPMTKHSEAVGQATHSLASLAPKTSHTPLCAVGCARRKQPQKPLTCGKRAKVKYVFYEVNI